MEGMDGKLPEFPIHLKLMFQAVSACFRELFLRKERVDRNSLFLRHVNYHDHDF